ncbi:MAG: hypothetical protein FWC58_03020 [Desulfobulbus sp.]|nr:hypothetical protein [Desulfobulbus sp.]
MHDDKTAHLALPLPHPGNALDVDCLRLRYALATLDSKVAALMSALSADDESLSNVQEIIKALKAAREDIAALDSLIDSKVAALTAELQGEISHLRPLIYAGL